jgi:cullin 4
LGHCVVKANGFSRPYEFIVSLSQALVLVQFNGRVSWTLPDLMKQIGMEDREEMERILQSLSVAKEGTRILKKIDFDASAQQKKKKTRSTVDDKDQFEVFEQFESNQRRIRINNIMMKESKEERDKTVEAVSRDRLYLIDAVLVRIMKARKTILHQNLIPQVLEQLKVPASATDVKTRIESLIEREYMERDAKDRNRYNYLA